MDPTFYPAYSYNPQSLPISTLSVLRCPALPCPALPCPALSQGLQIQQQPQENELSQEGYPACGFTLCLFLPPKLFLNHNPKSFSNNRL
jgi:hypothetical protein